MTTTIALPHFWLLLAIQLQFLLVLSDDSQGLWVQQHIGYVTEWYFDHQNPDRFSYVSTDANIIACLDLQKTNEDQIRWRQVLSSEETISKFLYNANKKYLLTLSNNKILRKWDIRDGSLLWENQQFKQSMTKQPTTTADVQIIDNEMIFINNENELILFDIQNQPLFNQNIFPTDFEMDTNSNKNEFYVNDDGIFVISFFDDSVMISHFSGLGSMIKREIFKHECSLTLISIPKYFEILSVAHSSSLVILYQCLNEISPLSAFSIELKSNTFQFTPLSISFQKENLSFLTWKIFQNENNIKLIVNNIDIYLLDINIKLHSIKLSKKIMSDMVDINNNWLSMSANARGSITKYWLDSSSLAIMTDDGSLCFMDIENVDEYEIQWCRDESLAYPLKIAFFDETQTDVNTNWIQQTFEKVITVLTSNGKLFGILSTDGSILWSINLNLETNDYSIVDMFVQSEHPPKILIIFNCDQCSNGKLSKIISISSPFQETSTIFNDFHISSIIGTSWINPISNLKIVLFLDSTQMTVHLYNPSNSETLSNFIQDRFHLIFYQTINDQIISGYTLQMANDHSSYSCVKLWSKSFMNSNERLVAHVFSKRNQMIINSIYQTGERGALYKYLNPHLFAIATVDDHQLLHIYLLDGITGDILMHSFYEDCVSHSLVSLLIYENKFLITYYNSQTMMSELIVHDLWITDPNVLPTKERSAAEGYLKPENPLKHTFSSIYNSSISPFITSQVYNYPFIIQSLFTVTHTRYSVSNKWIIMQLQSGNIVKLDAAFVNTRRPISNEITAANKMEFLISYRKFLPFQSLWVLSEEHNMLNTVRGLVSVSTPIESTSLVFGYGVDFFFRRISPSRNFDTIPNDFDYLMLFLILGGVIVAIFVAKKLAQRRKLSKEWK